MQNLDPKALILFFTKNFLGTAYVLPLWFIGVFIFEKVWVNNIPGLSEDVVVLLLDGAGCIFLSLLVLGCYYWTWQSYIHFTYELQPDGFHINSGALLRRHTVIPYSDIESVDLLMNPIVARTLNLFTLSIRTRDRENSEGIFKKKFLKLIPGLNAETARSLRAELLQASHLHSVKKTYFDPQTGNYR